MGQPGIADFHADLEYADRARLRLNGFYRQHAMDGRFVAIERSPGSLWIQRNAHIDCIVASRKGGSVTVEEKIVRWPGYRYTAMTLETHSNLERTGSEDIGDGWMRTSTADLLLYAFEQEDGGLLVWLFDMPALRHWFADFFSTFRTTDADNRYYTTRCRVVPLDSVPDYIVRIAGEEIP